MTLTLCHKYQIPNVGGYINWLWDVTIFSTLDVNRPFCRFHPKRRTRTRQPLSNAMDGIGLPRFFELKNVSGQFQGKMNDIKWSDTWLPALVYLFNNIFSSESLKECFVQVWTCPLFFQETDFLSNFSEGQSVLGNAGYLEYVRDESAPRRICKIRM